MAASPFFVLTGKTGAYLDMLYPHLLNPMGVAMTADNMLGVSELGSRSVKDFRS